MDKKIHSFKITPENVDYLVGGSKSAQEDPDKRRVLKNLHFEGQFISEQTKRKLKNIWW